MKKEKWIILIIAFIVIAGVFALIVGAEKGNVFLTLMEGLFSSIIVSTVFLIVSFYLSNKAEKNDCPRICVQLKNMGIKDITAANDVSVHANLETQHYWKSILLNSGTKDLYLMSRSLSTWIQFYKEDFKKALKNVLKNGKDVYMIIHGSNNTHNSDGLKALIEVTIGEIVSFKNALIPDGLKGKLHFVHIDDKLLVPYSYIRNDKFTYVEIYCVEDNAKHGIIVQYDNTDSEYGIAARYQEDFEKLYIEGNTLL